jgi:glucose/arabinose dehydrogenase
VIGRDGRVAADRVAKKPQIVEVGQIQGIGRGKQPGTVRVLSGTTLAATPLLDISASTLSTGLRGLHGVAVHPGFADSQSPGYRKVYAITSETAGTAPADLGTAGQNGADHQSVLYEWSIDAGNPGTVDPATKREILRIDEPGTIHGLYSMAFGPDGYLYLGVGDGAGGGDPFNLAQDPATIHGGIVRIDVDATDGRNGQYGIPASNPFAGGTLPGGGAALPEVFAYGFRNPWRMSFDAVTGDLYVGEVGRAVMLQIMPVPEPWTMSLAAAGLAMAAWRCPGRRCR